MVQWENYTHVAVISAYFESKLPRLRTSKLTRMQNIRIIMNYQTMRLVSTFGSGSCVFQFWVKPNSGNCGLFQFWAYPKVETADAFPVLGLHRDPLRRGRLVGSGTLQFAISDYTITITDQIANCRSKPLSANYDLKKSLQFLKKNYTVCHDRELQKWATFCKSRSQEKLYISQGKLYNFP